MDGFYTHYDSETDNHQVGYGNNGVAANFIKLATNVFEPDLSIYHKGTKIIDNIGQLETLSFMKDGGITNVIYRANILTHDKLVIQIECLECDSKILTARNKSWTSLVCVKCRCILFFHPKQISKKKEWLKIFFKKEKKRPLKKRKFENNLKRAQIYAEDCFKIYTFFKSLTYSYGPYFSDFLKKIAIFLRRFGDHGEFRDIFISSKEHVTVLRYLMFIYLECDYRKIQRKWDGENVFFRNDYVRQHYYQQSDILLLKEGKKIDYFLK